MVGHWLSCHMGLGAVLPLWRSRQRDHDAAPFAGHAPDRRAADERRKHRAGRQRVGAADFAAGDTGDYLHAAEDKLRDFFGTARKRNVAGAKKTGDAIRAPLLIVRCFYSTFFTPGIFHEPFRMVGSFSLGQYKRIIK